MSGSTSVASGNERAARRRLDRFLLWPLLCPAVLLAANNDAFGFDPPGWLDSYTYLGYFWHYREHLWLFDDNSNYKISRLPWVLPGAAAHSLLPPEAAARVLAYCALASAAIAVYLHVRDAIHDRYAAAFAGVLLACCTGMHAPGGWYYQALPAAGYYLWACWLLTRAAHSERRTAAWAAGAGAAFAAAVHTHVFLIVFAPLLVLLFWGAQPVDDRAPAARWLTAAVSAVAGAIGLTAALAIVNRVTGGQWWFFVPQVQIALTLAGHDRWWLPTKQWLPAATYLVLPIAMMVSGLISGYRPWKRDERIQGTLVVLPCVALALTCYFQFRGRVTTLDYDYMAFVLYLHAFPAAAVALGSLADRPARRATLLMLATALVLAALLFFMPSDVPVLMTRFVTRVGLSRLPPIVPPLLVALVGAIVARVLPRSVRVAAVAIWFAVVNAWVAPQSAAYGVRTAGTRAAMLDTFRQADRFTQRLDPTLTGIKYWLSAEDLPTAHGALHSQQVFDSFVATRAWLTNLFARQSPGLPIERLTRAHLARATCVGILSSEKEQSPLALAMIAHYASLGRPLRVIAQRRFDARGFSFALTVLKPVAAAPEAVGPAACAPGEVPAS